jgi:hypothetical protein
VCSPLVDAFSVDAFVTADCGAYRRPKFFYMANWPCVFLVNVMGWGCARAPRAPPWRWAAGPAAAVPPPPSPYGTAHGHAPRTIQIHALAPPLWRQEASNAGPAEAGAGAGGRGASALVP